VFAPEEIGPMPVLIDDMIDPAETRTWIVNMLAAIRPAPPRTGEKRPMIDA
jgi:acetyl-CoA carboxylase carboxyltransferase component